MKYIITLSVIIAFAVVSPHVIAQSGGFNVSNVTASNSLKVGTESENVVVLSELVALPPLTNSEIALLVAPTEGSLVYSSDSDVLLVFDGAWWKRADGQNDYYLAVPIVCTGTFYDHDGNSFQGVQIGTQCWMAENLKVTTFPNGEEIPLITTTASWIELEDTNSDVAYCYYDNEIDSLDIYGNLYTYAAAIAYNWTKDNDATNEEGGQGICPDGWHLPTDVEWDALELCITNDDHPGTEGTALKSETRWVNSGNGTDNYNFTALPGGYRYNYNGAFNNAGYLGFWWSATEDNSSSWNRHLYYSDPDVTRYSRAKSYGFSVRCVRN